MIYRNRHTPRTPTPIINAYFKVEKLRIGRIVFNNVSLANDEAFVRFQDTVNMLIERTGTSRPRSSTRYPEALPLSTPTRLLSVEARDYLNDMGRRGLGAKTIVSTGRTLGLLQKVCGDIPVSRIAHTHIYQLWDLLRWAPPGITSDPVLEGLSAADLMARGQAAGVRAPANATLERHRRFLAAFFTTLVRLGAIRISPMAAFSEAKPDLLRDPDKAERLFSAPDLQRIFHKDTFVPWASKHPHRWWGPMIGLYTGARITEVAQLKVSDVVNQHGLWCFAIRKTVDADLPKNARLRTRQSLKGKSAERYIPIAQPLLDAGFLDFMEDIKASGATRLFPHLSAGVNRTTGETNACYSQALGNQLGRYLRTLNFPAGVAFHAFRHTLATDWDDQGVREEDIALITGHAVSKKVPGLQTNYLHKKPLTTRARQLAALALYKPSVTLPVYTKGQFAARLRDKTKFYP